jgi:hypothetical protein
MYLVLTDDVSFECVIIKMLHLQKETHVMRLYILYFL